MAKTSRVNPAVTTVRPTVAAEPINYAGLIITTIKLYGRKNAPDVEIQESLNTGDQVIFNEMDGNEGSKAVFLKDIKQDMSESNVPSYRVFTATYVSPEDAAKIANEGFGEGNCSPFFFVHGFNNEPGYTLGEMMVTAMERFSKEKIHFPIPVIWPNYGSRLGYKYPDQAQYSLEAGENLKKLFDHIPQGMFPKKTLMLHSMGNHVVFNGACGVNLPMFPDGPPGPAPDIEFENIFMVAADVENDIFVDNPSEGWGYKREKASNMQAMLKEGGKIYVVHNQDDVLLKASGIVLNPGRTRLGLDGAYDVRSDLSDFVVNIDTKPFSDADENPDDPNVHSYHLAEWLMPIYANPQKYAADK